MDLLTHDDRLDSLLKAVRVAGAKLLARWPGRAALTTHTALRIEVKADGSQVTEADLESNTVLLGALKQLFPSDGVLSEEVAAEPHALSSLARVWVIDPLDGTKSFIEGRDDFSVLVAQADNGYPVWGAMFFPARGLMAVGSRAGGAAVGGTALRVSSSKVCRPGLIYIRNFSSERSELASPPMDSGMALLKVATGELDGAVIRMTTHKDWDIAAPIAVIQGAGGQVTDEHGRPIRLSFGATTAGYVVASNGLVHQELLDLVHAAK